MRSLAMPSRADKWRLHACPTFAPYDQGCSHRLDLFRTGIWPGISREPGRRQRAMLDFSSPADRSEPRSQKRTCIAIHASQPIRTRPIRASSTSRPRSRGHHLRRRIAFSRVRSTGLRSAPRLDRPIGTREACCLPVDADFARSSLSSDGACSAIESARYFRAHPYRAATGYLETLPFRTYGRSVAIATRARGAREAFRCAENRASRAVFSF